MAGGSKLSQSDAIATLYSHDLTWVNGTFTESGANSVVAEDSDAATRLVVANFVVQTASSSPVTVSFQDGTTTKFLVRCANDGDGVAIAYPPGLEWRLASTGALQLSLGSTGKVNYSFAYYSEAV